MRNKLFYVLFLLFTEKGLKESFPRYFFWSSLLWNWLWKTWRHYVRVVSNETWGQNLKPFFFPNFYWFYRERTFYKVLRCSDYFSWSDDCKCSEHFKPVFFTYLCPFYVEWLLDNVFSRFWYFSESYKITKFWNIRRCLDVSWCLSANELNNMLIVAYM